MNSYFWRIFLPLHVALLALPFVGAWSWWTPALVLALWALLSGYGIGVAFHRLLAHKAFKTRKWVEYLISYFGCLAVQGSPIFWVNVHRGYHHRYSDQERDIHSPIHGRWWAYFLWACKVKAEDVKFKYVPELFRDPVQKFLHYRYFYVVWATWLTVGLLSPTLLTALLLAQVITLHQEFCVNLFCHEQTRGYRNFDTPDNSVNLYWFGRLCWGVGFHNNHHGKPQDYNFGHLPGEVDLTKYLVRLIKT